MLQTYMNDNSALRLNEFTPLVTEDCVAIFYKEKHCIHDLEFQESQNGYNVKITGDDEHYPAPRHFIVHTADGYGMADHYKNGHRAISFIYANPYSPVAYLYGDLGDTFPHAISGLQRDFPHVCVLVLKDVMLGHNTDAIFEAMQMINDAGMATVLESDSVVALSGVNVFMAGKKRLVMAGAKIGISNFRTDRHSANPDVIKSMRDFLKQSDIRDVFCDLMYSNNYKTMHWLDNDEIHHYKINNTSLSDMGKMMGIKPYID